jgi:hypothetical protein
LGVDLVQHQDGLARPVGQPLGYALDVLAQAARGIHQQHRQIGFAGLAPGRAHHGAVEPAARAEDAGCVDKHQLAGAVHGDAANAPAGGLHLAADY